MLDSHPELAIPSESHFFHDIVRGGKLEQISKEQFFELIIGYFTWADFSLDERDLKRVLDAIIPFSLANGLRAFYHLYAGRFGKTRWGEKTPDYGMIMPEIAALLPEAHFVHIIRDGRDVALSRRPLWFGPGSDIAAQAEDWVRWILAARSFGRTCNRYLEIRYEALVASAAETLQHVCDFLHLAYRDEMLNYHAVADKRLAELKGWQQEHVTADQLRGIQELTASPPTTERSHRWKREMQADEVRTFEDIAGPVLEELGYEVAADGARGSNRGAASLARAIRRTNKHYSVSGLLLTHHITDEAMPWLLELRALVDEFVVLVDTQLADDCTRARISQLATRTEEFAPDGVAEAFLSKGVGACRTDWILRLDSDEELSMEWHDGAWRELLALGDYNYFWIPRRWITSPGKYLPVHPWFPDYQIRLFRNEPSKIRFGTTLHGVMEIPGRYAYIRSLAIHHHVLSLLSRAKREEKVRFYDTLPGGGLGHYYLYEDYELPQAPVPSGTFEIQNELLHMGMLFEGEIRAVSIQASGIVTACIPRQLFWPTVRISNETERMICSDPPFPVNLAYHWIETASGRVVVHDGDRTPLFRPLPPKSEVEVSMLVVAPVLSGDYRLQITLVQEGIQWFEQRHASIIQEFVVTVREPDSSAGL
jgi:hypothetical protein